MAEFLRSTEARKRGATPATPATPPEKVAPPKTPDVAQATEGAEVEVVAEKPKAARSRRPPTKE